MATLDFTIGGANANSYESLAEANTYFADERLPLVPPWLPSGQYNVQALIMATRVLDALAQPFKTFFPATGSDSAYYKSRRQWTGAPATATQRLAWPRTGMYTRNGNLIASDVIPQELKDAESEFAGQLLKADSTLDNSVSVQGITSVRAGSVSVTFKDMIEAKVLPDAVYNLLPASWLTEEVIEGVIGFDFEVISD